MKVKNLNNTSTHTPPKGFKSEKDYYSSKKIWPSVCACMGCNNPAEVGAHVIKCDSYDRRWFITPMCKFHNAQFGEVLDIYGEWIVPLNVD